MARYRVTFEIEVHEGNPLNWLPETVEYGLEQGESASNWYAEEIEENQNEPA